MYKRTLSGSCTLFQSQKREFTQHSLLDARVDSHHLIVWHFNFIPPAQSPQTPILLSLPIALSLFPHPQSFPVTLSFSVLKSNFKDVNHLFYFILFFSLVRVGSSLTQWHVHWEIFFVHQSDLPVLVSPGRGVHYNTGILIYVTLCLVLSLSLSLSALPVSSFFLAFFTFGRLYLSL